MEKTLRKSRSEKKILGICGGIAEFFDTDVTLIRLLLVIFTILGGSGLLFYLIAALIMR